MAGVTTVAGAEPDLPAQMVSDGVAALARPTQRALDRGRVDQGVGPAELQGVDSLLETHRAGFAYQGEVFGVVDRQLDLLPVRDGGKIDVLGGGRPDGNQSQGQGEQPTKDLASRRDSDNLGT